MKTFARRYWFVPAGIVVAAIVAASFGSTLAWVLMAIYTAFNLLGTMILIAPGERDDGGRPGCFPSFVRHGEDRIDDVWGLVFVLQLPLGVLVFVFAVLLEVL